eukprot:CAMPEP_0177719136 /NCGR_PEP_ID=MMETSP0484_2-20121128/15944_1 /TAXON_ID=354590 /ORGANISM="Rhodomonas lens, Strain RHODO" /LENGTH=676 /DNA_ID=CAMNT_0019231337 /DNA_START=79 /DNA_END=2110 /DNA_ORIENTATION=+
MSETPASSGGTLGVLDQLRISLQRAATIANQLQRQEVCCKPRRASTADMEDVDSDEGVGVDERAAELSPEDFLQEDDEEWFSSARWVLNRQETRDFIAASLLSHLAPLYVPYAAIDAQTPADIVPEDVQKDIEAFTDDFVLDQNLYSMSVQDVKDGVGAALGGSGLMFIPHEMPVYDDTTFKEAEGHISALGAFGDKFEDTDDGWHTWYTIFQGDASVEEDDDDADDDDDDDDEDDDDEAVAAAAGNAMDGLLSGSSQGGEAGAGQAEGQQGADEEDASDLAAAGSTQTERQAIEKSAAKEAARGQNARALLREVIAAVLAEKVGLSGLPLASERAMAALEQRLAAGKNARNALMLLKRTTCHPIRSGTRLGPEHAAQAALQMLLAGPLRSIRIESEDLPAAAVKEAEAFGKRVLEKASLLAQPVESAQKIADVMLTGAREDAELARGVSGWCLKFLFEGEGMEEAARRQDAFKQHANELVSGPFAGISAEELEGQVVWKWDDAKVKSNPALDTFAVGYGEGFELLAGSTLASVLATFRESLAAAGFELAPWCQPVDPEDVKAAETKGAAVDAATSIDGHEASLIAPPTDEQPEQPEQPSNSTATIDVTTAKDYPIPDLGQLPTPPASSVPLPPGFKFEPPPLPPGLESTPLPVPPVTVAAPSEDRKTVAEKRAEC